MYKDDKVVGYGTLCGNLYRLDLFSNGLNYYVNSVVAPIVASKRPRVNDNSSMLWHKRLRHISRNIMEMLVKDGILPNLDLSDLSTCVECVKGKLTSKVRKDKIARCGDVLDLIHNDICGPFTPTTLGVIGILLPSLMISLVMDMLSLSVRSWILWLPLRSLR